MQDPQRLCFGPFCLDLAHGSLRRGKRALFLTPKAFAMLRYLVEHAGQLVSKEELWQALWPGTAVTDAALTVCMSELRKALGDRAQSPQYVQTVHRRGYRFIAPLSTDSAPVPRTPADPAPGPSPPAPIMIGRDPELARLHYWIEQALRGQRQLVLVTGEPGIGKTTVVDAFLRQVATAHELWVGRGQCIEQYGAGEAYMPLLEALGRLGREPGGKRLVALLRHYAPTWLVQLPALLPAAEFARVQRKVQGATRERMLREMADAIEALTAERPLVLWLEDLQWSDVSTLELLALLARRREPARLLVVGTYRPVDMLSADHPLKRVTHELYAHRLGQELALERLTESEVSAYLTRRFPDSVLPTRLGEVLHHRTGGNPLFLASLVQELTQREVLRPGPDGRWEWHGTLAVIEQWMPQSVRHVLARQRERLAPAEQRVLEAASLAGLEFSAATVAAALESAVSHVEEHCGRLAEQQHCLRLAGISDWPDGTRAARYGFQHALYQEWWHERVSVDKQQQWHLRMGERKEVAYGPRAGEIAAELALHFEQGRDMGRAVRYLEQAVQTALQRCAYQEATSRFTKGLALLTTLPDTPERAQQELTLQIALGPALMVTQGYAAPEVEKAYTRARELCQQVGETPQLFPILWGLWAFYLIRAELQTARELGEQLLALAQSTQDPALLLQAHGALGQTFYGLGELTQARAHAEQGIALYEPQHHHSLAPRYGTQDPGVTCLGFLSIVLWLLGYPAQALERSQEALTLAQRLSHPHSLAMALNFMTGLHRYRREVPAVQERAAALIALCTEQGFPYWLACGTTLGGWALAEQGQREEGIAQMQEGLAAWRAIGAEVVRSYYLALLAEAYGKKGQAAEGLTVLAEASAAMHKTGEQLYEAEVYRLKGELTLVQSSGRSLASRFQKEAEKCFRQAIGIARKQSAKSLELRAVMSLSRLWRQQSKREEARQMLAEVYGWFTEGFDTKDLQEAKALLVELSGK